MIPKTIHQCFFSTEPASEWPIVGRDTMHFFRNRFAHMCMTFSVCNPDYQYNLWTYDNIPEIFPDTDIEKRALEIINSKLIFTLKADVMRLVVIYKYGGIYADTDFICQKSLDPLLPHQGFIAQQRKDCYYSSAFYGAVPEHPAVLSCLTETVLTIERAGDRRDIDRMAVLDNGFHIASRHLQRIGYIAPTAWFFPFFCTEIDKRGNTYPDSFAVHQWSSQDKDGWCNKVPGQYIDRR